MVDVLGRSPSKEPGREITFTGSSSLGLPAAHRSARKMSVDVKNLLPERVGARIAERYSFRKDDELGSGGFGKVYIAHDKLFGDRRVAVKQMPCKSAEQKKVFAQEVEMMKQLDHPNICKLFETYDAGNMLYLVLDLCEGSEVFDRIKEHGKLSEQSTADVIRQVASALKYAHCRGVAHRDLKPENICYYSADPKSTEIKVIDWGLAINFGGLKRMKSAVGSQYYAAPEVLTTSAYTEACDLWSLGVVTYVMLSGKAPFWGSESEQLANMYACSYPMRSETWQKTSLSAKNFIKRLLKPEPANRMTIDQVVAHSWLKEQLPPTDPEVATIVLDNMMRFSNTSYFLSIIVASVARQLDHRSLHDVHSVFRDMDANGDGLLELCEVKAGFEKLLGPESDHVKHVDTMFRQLDLDGSGRIAYTEFVAAAMSEQFLEKEEALWNAFRSFDCADDGKITTAEICGILERTDVKKTWTPELCQRAAEEIVQEFDTNGDGVIDFQEFVQVLRGQLAAARVSAPEEERQILSELDAAASIRRVPSTAAPFRKAERTVSSTLVRQLTDTVGLGKAACVTCGDSPLSCSVQ
eukprot:TRINITY_DN43429_c1_g4_i2.p1 TRINITY_DN43429_c1_g4~~TRINITY_DN43429_c1_g4_i2.p1  ORF type:complete len:581 (+),score=86.71 TRINITY_DN43429_c1_g4_i2:156-1898(+)